MSWGVAIFAFLFVFAYRRATRAGERLAECAPTGMLRSPLFLVQTALLVILLGLMFAPAYLPRGSASAAVIYFVVLVLDVVALLLVRRALKWRYPI